MHEPWSAMERLLILAAFVSCPVLPLAKDASSEVWVEAESFQSLGGWFVDQQSFGQMGSAYVMAQGIGVAVEDAKTWFTVPADGKALPEGEDAALGTNGADWAWQKAGVVDLKRGAASMALRDLTGFNGRCDAIYFTTDPELQ